MIVISEHIGPVCRAILCAALLIGGTASEAVAQSNGHNRKLLGNENSSQEICPGSIDREAASDPKELTLLGVTCFKQQKFARAYTYYHRAFDIEESSLLMAAMGRSLHELGLYGLAEDYYREFLESEGTGGSTSKIQNRLDQLDSDLASKSGKAHFASFPSQATVYVRLRNGEWVKLGQTPATVQLEEGRYEFAFDRTGYRRRMVTRRVASGSSPTELDVQLYRESSTFDVTARGWKRAGAYTSLASVPLLGIGALYFGLSADKFAEAEDYTFEADYVPARQNRMVEKGHAFQRTAIGLTAVGGVTLVTGTILFLNGVAMTPKAPESASTARRLRLRPVVSPTGVGLVGRF